MNLYTLVKGSRKGDVDKSKLILKSIRMLDLASSLVFSKRLLVKSIKGVRRSYIWIAKRMRDH